MLEDEELEDEELADEVEDVEELEVDNPDEVLLVLLDDDVDEVLLELVLELPLDDELDVPVPTLPGISPKAGTFITYSISPWSPRNVRISSAA